MLLIYNAVLLIGAVFLIPYYLVKMWRTGKYRRSLRQRLGVYESSRHGVSEAGPMVWVHGCSVGETMAGFPLIERLRQRLPDHRIVSSAVTETGFKVAEKEKLADERIYFPLDFPFSVRRAFDAFPPALLVIMETEIWPNAYWQAFRRSIPIVIANGRISDASYPTYRSYRWFFRHVLRNVSLFCMQSETEAARIIDIGASPERVLVTGNTKFDQIERIMRKTDTRAVRNVLEIPDGNPVLVAGSTHYNEEKQLVTVYRSLRAEFPELSLVLAPRHPERINGVLEYLRNAQLSPLLLSELKRRHRDTTAAESSLPRVVLVDTVGDLASLYSLATVVFVGGSLVPVGGHNILEPAAFGKPVVYGPHMFNFVEETGLLDGNGCLRIRNHEALQDVFHRLLRDRTELTAMGQRARAAIAARMGGSDAIVSAMEERGLL